jgi:protein TonB
MNFAQQQRDPRRHLMGISTVVLIHVIAIYALTNGLAHKFVEVLKKPLDVSIIEELKKAPPPPPPKVIEPPKVVEPPPAFVPPPDIQIQAPPPVITVTAPTPPPVVVAPPVPAPPRVASVGVVCPDHVAVLSKIQVPVQAQGQAGKVIVEFLVSATGAVGDVTIVKSTNRLFNAVATAAVGQLHCVGQGQNVRVQVPFVFEQER